MVRAFAGDSTTTSAPPGGAAKSVDGVSMRSAFDLAAAPVAALARFATGFLAATRLVVVFFRVAILSSEHLLIVHLVRHRVLHRQEEP